MFLAMALLGPEPVNVWSSTTTSASNSLWLLMAIMPGSGACTLNLTFPGPTSSFSTCTGALGATSFLILALFLLLITALDGGFFTPPDFRPRSSSLDPV